MKTIISKSILLLLFVGFTQLAFSQSPVEFNNKLVRITDTLFTKGQAWGSKFSEVHASREYSKLAPIRQDLEIFLESKVREFKTMADVSDSKKLREGMIEFLVFELQMANSVFKPFEKLDSTSSFNDINTVIENLKKAAEIENTLLQKYRQLQKEYALSNEFTIAGG